MYSKLLGVLLWIGLAGGVLAEPILKPLFNGKDLSGWKVPAGNDAAGWYKAVDGVLKIQSGPKKKGSVLWTEKAYGNFMMELEFRFGEKAWWTAACTCVTKTRFRSASAAH